MKKKYEFTGETKNWLGITLHRIKSLVQIETKLGTVGIGDLGGWLEKEDNLSHEGDAWVCGDAVVCGYARVCGDAWVCGDAVVCGNARVYGDAEVWGNAEVYGSAKVCGYAEVCGYAKVSKSSHILVVGPLGSRGGFTTFVRTKNGGILMSCGCFLGSIDEFLDKVKETHGDSKYAKEYRAAA